MPSLTNPSGKKGFWKQKINDVTLKNVWKVIFTKVCSKINDFDSKESLKIGKFTQTKIR